MQNFTLDKNGNDGFGHGTFTSSLLFFRSSSCPGKLNALVSDGKVQVHMLKVFNGRRHSSESFIKQALEYCIRNSIRIIALPLGTQTLFSKEIRNLFRRVVSKGGVIISAAGNEGPDLGTLTSPGDQDLVLSIGSFSKGKDDAFIISDFSSRGPSLSDVVERQVLKFKPDVLALGEGIWGADRNARKCVAKSGTSLSAILGKLGVTDSGWYVC